MDGRQRRPRALSRADGHNRDVVALLGAGGEGGDLFSNLLDERLWAERTMLGYSLHEAVIAEHVAFAVHGFDHTVGVDDEKVRFRTDVDDDCVEVGILDDPERKTGLTREFLG